MDYQEIIDTALSYADRAKDQEVIDRMDGFLRMIEPRINRAFQVRNMSVRAVVVCVDGQEYYGLPSDFNGIRDIEVYPVNEPENKDTLKFLPPEAMNNYQVTAGNRAIYYTIIADQFQIKPAQTSANAMEIVYYQNLSELSSSNRSNWVSFYAPDAYVNGLMVEINAFVKDKEAAVLWDSRFMNSLKEIERNDDITRWSGTPLEIRTA
jgi:hypothetical protein